MPGHRSGEHGTNSPMESWWALAQELWRKLPLLLGAGRASPTIRDTASCVGCRVTEPAELVASHVPHCKLGHGWGRRGPQAWEWDVHGQTQMQLRRLNPQTARDSFVSKDIPPTYRVSKDPTVLGINTQKSLTLGQLPRVSLLPEVPPTPLLLSPDLEVDRILRVRLGEYTAWLGKRQLIL